MDYVRQSCISCLYIWYYGLPHGLENSFASSSECCKVPVCRDVDTGSFIRIAIFQEVGLGLHDLNPTHGNGCETPYCVRYGCKAEIAIGCTGGW